MPTGTEVPRRRLAALHLMERVKRQEIESIAGELARLRAEAARLAADRATLLNRLTEESHATSLEAVAYLGQFIRSVRNQVALIDAQVAAMRPRLDKLEAEVADLYADKRTYEVVRTAAEAANAKLRQKREDQAADDLVLMRWRRG